ncbi:B12-binding domain-containing radical SAM protein [Candidatus Albibeggiatoa sp. nov. NOAA]|uniref:B12-binding domain-containing radical SAM protein n=1 Tax=Candidatus Albibeggiatoa sp. nov. NOAA TaxID=3162724 RepID=UPI0032F5367E|nr:radical SAM protein [Thiotrichaceae bacterium]
MTTKVDVVFIHPGDKKQIYQGLANEFSATEPPIFAGLFATYLQRKGYSAAIIDGPAHNLSVDEIAEQAVSDLSPKLIVIVVYGNQPSASTQNMTVSGKVATAIKQHQPNMKIMMTGTHPAALPRRTITEEDVDFVCDREGPVTIYKTLQALDAKLDSFSDIPSLWWKKEGVVFSPTSSEGLIKSLDEEMPGVAWDLLPMENYRAHNWHCFDHIHDRTPYAAIHTSMGCPYKCSFCCINAPFGKNVYRMWSVDSVMKEIDFLVEHYGVKNIKFIDEMFVLNKAHVLGICDALIQRNYEVNIWAYARIDTVKDEYLDKLKTAGFNWLALGIESASDFVRDGSDKHMTNEDIINTVKRIQAAGIHVIGNYIFGLPDDSYSRMQETLDMALDLNCEFSNIYSAMAYPGSKLYTETLQNNPNDLPTSWHQYSQHAFDSKPVSNAFCSSEEILAFRDKAWEACFTSPKYLDLVQRKFGTDVVKHIERMTATPLPRKKSG